MVTRRFHHLFIQGITEYDFRGIDKNSVVLDLGASVGGFSIHAAKRCKHVYSVEPLFTDFLNANLQINHVENCTVIPFAISDREYTGNLSFFETEKEVRFMPFKKILSFIPEHVDFLKCDIEGAEQYVDFNLFNNIEAELHNCLTVNNVKSYHKRNGIEVELLRGGYEQEAQR
ncbi:MAG: FkbM family methyltransferase [Thermoplasmata archaeon]|nr:FkbM family methyltransferase [Thermoplasmata archaeon]